MNIRGHFLRMVPAVWLLISAQAAFALSFPTPALEQAYLGLTQQVNSYRPGPAIALADSILQEMKLQGFVDHELFLWVRFQQSHAMLMNYEMYDRSLKQLYEVIDQAENRELWELAAESYLSIALNHEFLEREKDCIRNLNYAWRLIADHDLGPTSARYCVRRSSYHRLFADHDSAKFYAERAIELGTAHQVLRSVKDGNMVLGIIAQDPLDQIFYRQKCYQICLELEDYFSAIFQKINILKSLVKVEGMDNAFSHWDSARSLIPYIDQSNDNYWEALSKLYETKSELFEMVDLQDSALHYFKLFHEAEFQAFNASDLVDIQQQETQFAVQREQEKLKAEKERAQLLIGGISFLALLLTGLGWALWRNGKQRKLISTQNEQITTQNQALEESLNRQSMLLSEVHHRVKNNLQLVISLLTLQGLKIEQEHVQLQIDQLSNKVHSIALIHDQLYQAGEFEAIDLTEYIGKLIQYFQELASAEAPFSIETDITDISLNLETVLPLGIICSELITNSLKYARLPDRPLIISLKIVKLDQGFEMQYRDNGPGYPSGKFTTKASSMGGVLIKSMARQLRTKPETQNEGGAVCTMKFSEKWVSQV
ncbi:histidine kinase dimerization/phosphoacceptor domain -containing protein [Pontibacter sp. G13]|uniref:sensor histidine kinase n=1 Tax=Pontibacter sp. G13 TaxID=3074898 RepID=UPI00288940FC|nr:histidine kinase dimerization/phosphoacceptor domain -containing protein [Pontibacter sp. G13]WNJ17008.1 histidine kinase dimerization/phosphoacceptor domain -containing protein [Pontibacter sp. G13]